MTVYQATGSIAAPADVESLSVPEFMLDNPFLPPDLNDPGKPDWVCFIDDATGRQLRFSEVRSRVGYLSAALQDRERIKSGDIVAVICANDIDYATCCWAIHRCGAIVAPMSPTMTADEMVHPFRLASPTVLITQTELSALVKDAAKRAGLVEYRTILLDGNAESGSEYPTIDSLIAYGKTLPPFSQPALSPGEAKTKIAFLSFSSGTTGLPKESAICISHYNVIINVLQAEALNQVYDPQLKWADKRYRPGGVCSGVLPLYHMYGLMMNLHFVLYTRMTSVITRHFNFETMLANIARYRITNLFLVPPQALLICQHPAVERYDLSSVRACMIAAAPVSAELTQNLLRALPGIHLGQGYGMTEACAAVSLFPISPKISVLGSGGQLVPGTLAKIVKSDGTLGSTGERGELYVQGPQVTLGYYKNPTATNESFTDGWLRTGDEALFDEEGNLFIVDRIKELIKVKGFQVAPAELEGHLLDHADVADAAVIGIPDDFSGELPLAFIVLKPKVASEVKNDAQARKTINDSIFEHVSTKKSPYKWLTGGIKFVEVIPKSPSGKILRRFLREQLKQSGAAPRARL